MNPVILSFLLGFIFSFLGSIPPGTLNITIIQLGLANQMKAAWRFALAVALIEYPYGWIAVRFADFISSRPEITHNIHLFASILMIALGVLSLQTAGNVSKLYQRFNTSGFRRGIVLGILNPLALPFWIGITAYLKGINLIDLATEASVQAYLVGICLGALALMVTFAYLAKRMLAVFRENSLIKKIPGVTLLALGLYGLFYYFQ